jgi:hypothetical protein
MLDKYIIRFCIFLDNLVAPIDRIFETKKKKGKKKNGRANNNN